MLYKLLFIQTMRSGSGLSLSGPWWFFGLIFQLYILFPLIFKIIEKHRIKAFITICFVSYAWTYISQYVYRPDANVWLLQNAPGHLPEFALGILIALSPGKKIHYIWGILSLFLFSLGNFYKPFFPLTFLTATILVYWGSSKMIPLILSKTRMLKKVLLYYGSISMALFAVHGQLRPPFITISGETFWGRLCGSLLFLIAATAISILANMLYKWLTGKIVSISFKRKTELPKS
jgi:peptidoglycan/LPS O-acetylase OafA/YrhL